MTNVCGYAIAINHMAVKVKSLSGNPNATMEDLSGGIIKEVNAGAAKLGITIGMTVIEALDLL